VAKKTFSTCQSEFISDSFSIFFNRKVRKVKNLWICGEKNLLYLSIWIYFRFFFNFFNRKVRKGFRKLRKVKNLWICGKKNVLYLSIWIYFRFYFNLDLSTTINFPNINYPLTHSRFGTLSFGKGRGIGKTTYWRLWPFIPKCARLLLGIFLITSCWLCLPNYHHKTSYLVT
jgi:hypothetical protein